MIDDPRAKCSDADFIKLFTEIGPTEAAKTLGVTLRNVFARRGALERLYKAPIAVPIKQNARKIATAPHPQRAHIEIETGTIIVGSDAHIWPGPMSTAMRGFIKFIKDMKPAAVILNGDVVDLPQISRHPPIGWTDLPTVQQEIEAAQDILARIEDATFKARKIWTLGNHDSRFETRIATVAPEYAKIAGASLRDHFPTWEPGWSCWINGDSDDGVVVKHRWKGGVHAPHNNAVNAGKHMVTGHLHSAKVSPYTNYRATTYGVDTGCLADTDAKAFVDYTEDSPKSWISAFGVLTFHKGRLLWPEIAAVVSDGVMQFRGQLIEV